LGVRFGFWTLLVLWSCAARPTPCPSLAPRLGGPVLERTLFLDWSFTPTEKVAIRDAAERLNEQTDGRIRFWFDGIPDAYLYRVHEHDDCVDDADAHFQSQVYAWKTGSTIRFVIERLPSSHALTHTAMHELLHVLGVWHVQEPDAIMAAGSDARTAPLVLTPADWEALREATGI
jgi:hypothetical protein